MFNLLILKKEKNKNLRLISVNFNYELLNHHISFRDR